MTSSQKPLLPVALQKTTIAPSVQRYMDLNTDLGQSRDRAFFQSEDGGNFLQRMSSVNIPCGLHDGHPLDLLAAIEQAKKSHCAIGAHVGFPDPAHYGYEAPDLQDDELRAWLLMQLGAFRALLNTHQMDIEHVRPHGALYLKLLDHEPTARVLANTLYTVNPWTILLGPLSPMLKSVCEEVGLRYAPEISLGRLYHVDGRLHTGRLQEFLSPAATVEQARQLIRQNELMSWTGKPVEASGVKSLHLSPAMPEAPWVAEQVGQLLGQAIPLSIALVGKTGWVETFDDRRIVAPKGLDEY